MIDRDCSLAAGLTLCHRHRCRAFMRGGIAHISAPGWRIRPQSVDAGEARGPLAL